MKRIILISAASVFIITVSGYLHQCNKEYYALYNAVKVELGKIEGIEVLELWGNEDLTLEDIYATLRLGNGDTIRLHNLLKNSFDSTSYLWLSQINQWNFHMTGCYGKIDYELGFPASYEAFRKLEIKNVQGIIKNIDTLKKIVNTIATYPAFDTLVNIDGETFYYQKYDTRLIPNSWELEGIECSK